MNQLENSQARYPSNTWMSRTRTDGPDKFEPSKFDCSYMYFNTDWQLDLLERGEDNGQDS